MKIYRPLTVKTVLPGVLTSNKIVVSKLPVVDVAKAIHGNTIAITNESYTVVYDILDCKEVIGSNPETVVDLLITPDGVTIKRHVELKTDGVAMSDGVIEELEDFKNRFFKQMFGDLF